MQQSGYYRYPTINGDDVVFVCEDDLWKTTSKGGIAIRLTSNFGDVSHAMLSPDKKYIAFTGREEGHSEVYLMSSDGGQEKRLTYLGKDSLVVGWTDDSKSIIFSTNFGQAFAAVRKVYKVSLEGGIPELLPIGTASSVFYNPNGKGSVLCRNATDIARWKRYRGGRTGVIWIDATGSGDFKKLLNLKGNFANPMWIGERIYFVSDHEGIGNIYSSDLNGGDVKRHTDSKEYYVRNASTDGKNIVYHAGADLFIYNIESEINSQINIDFHSPKVQKQRKFVSSSDYLDGYNIHPEGHSLALTTRGKPFVFPNWDGAVTQLGESDGVRYRLTNYLNDKERFITLSDEGGEEHLKILSTKIDFNEISFKGLNLGRTLKMKVSPTEDKVLLTNHRHELILVDFTKQEPEMKVLDKSEHRGIDGFSWSPDGKWVTYGLSETKNTCSIKICDVIEFKVYNLTSPRFVDFCPSFDPEGKFIYFLSYREFDPVYDSIYFDLNFPKGARPCLVSLKKDTLSPFMSEPKPPKGVKTTPKEEDKKENTDDKDKKDKKKVSIEIDFDNIENRILEFPVPEGRYRELWALKGKVLFTQAPVKGSLSNDWTSGTPDASLTLSMYDFEEQKTEVVANDITDFKVSRENETLIYRAGNRLRVLAVAPLDKNKPADSKPSMKTGWIDLNRIKVSVDPEKEWKQMYHEVWRLQSQHFWVSDMSGVDWNKVYERYLPLLDKVATRSEFSDLIWEMQGELGSSHAYEIGGDYRTSPRYAQGFLGADFEYDSETDAYKFKHIVKGDSWEEKADSPLNGLGINIQKGDLLLGIGSSKVSKDITPQQLLVNKADSEVLLTVSDSKKEKIRTVRIKTLRDETKARYREWIESNREKVHQATNGKVGYVHIPNMGPLGYSEFHRYYFVEVEKDSLIVDVRFNGGGHVSQLLLEKLARKTTAYVVQRWGKPESHPDGCVLGSLVAITNENAGSDGDIFSHTFKLMKLGKLVGTRTWGGVIGISPSHRLVDKTITTQPEYSFWFTDVGWNVENYGTDPDVEVEMNPRDYVEGKDPQLQKAIEIALEELKTKPVMIPDFSHRPKLYLP